MDVSKESEKSEYNSDQEAAKHSTTGEPFQDDPQVPTIKRKVDLRLSAILALLYCVNQIDRNNLPNA